MKITILGVIILALAKCVQLSEEPVGPKSVTDENKQFTELVSPNPVEHQNKKRHTLEQRLRHKKILPGSKIHIPTIVNIIPDEPVTPHIMRTNNPEIPSTSLNSIDDDETPKFVFSSLHMKLVPKEDEVREEELLKELQPVVSEGEISAPELILDALDPYEIHHENGPDSIKIIHTDSESSHPHTNEKNPISFHLAELAEHILLNHPNPMPISPFDSVDHPYIEEPLTDIIQGGAIDAASNLVSTQKPLMKISVKSKLRLRKYKPEESTTVKPPLSTTNKSDDDEDEDISDIAAEQDQSPHCPSGSDFVRGSKKLWRGFRKADSWSGSFRSVGKSAKKAANSVKLCFQRMWQGVKNMFGFGRKRRFINYEEEENSDPENNDSKRAAESDKTNNGGNKTKEAKEKGGWTKTKEKLADAKVKLDKHVAKPVVSFFNKLGEKTKKAFSRRQIGSKDLTDAEGLGAVESPLISEIPDANAPAAQIEAI